MGWAILVQVILRDLRPLIQVKSNDELENALTDYTSMAKPFLGIEDAMEVWHPHMSRIRKFKARLDSAAELCLTMPRTGITGRDLIGEPIQVSSISLCSLRMSPHLSSQLESERCPFRIPPPFTTLTLPTDTEVCRWKISSGRSGSDGNVFRYHCRVET